MTLKDPHHLREEIANSLTHGLGAGLAIAGVSVLLTLASLRGDAYQIISIAIYGATLILLYLISTFYHSFHSPRIKEFFRLADHSAIYLLIAGSYTPFALISLRGGIGWTVFGVVWGLALLGVIFKFFFRFRYHFLATGLYIFMGWMALLILNPLLEVLPFWCVVLLFASGISYTLGMVFYAWNRLPYNHAIWHAFVVLGSICHYFAVFYEVLPKS
ncbi:MAG: hemolysin III family protein [Candidatus Omnitrophica bacterium]|nr:hemolysin III family protein [Candidatus Omnitrophota bacterium]MCA9427046.1 hemolysin III family protein [Candidatus Omnitrophota bacterium]MCA9430052.1 hemolysin III family protein [Candidatus Omnitrophota bacterium]MCA9449457.1 hemolysin III family protein [Candidatus Omnitrophota bacterium]MCB9782484.1 hemolysin III family protein [Candidatus Omnitrophota bacterium]